MKTWLFKESHILERIEERFNPKNAKEELERIKKVLQNNVPDDWRLTRFSPDFLIRDLKTDIALVGYQERIKCSEAIWKNVSTALYKESFSKAKIGKHSTSQYVFEIARRPNLLIGNEDMHEIFAQSPVLARQYEKVVYQEISIPYEHNHKRYSRAGMVKGPIEYYRFHPLKKSGLDRSIFVWAEWDATTGVCIKVGAVPPKDFHGEDFWMLQIKKE